jgi:hypothetical protein
MAHPEARQRPIPGSGPQYHDHPHRLVAPSTRRNITAPDDAPLSPQCLRTPMRGRRSLLNHTVECSGGDQFSMTDGTPPATTPPRSSCAEAAAHQIPIDGRPPASGPRVPSSEAFGRRLSPPADRSRPAGIRNPSREQSSVHARSNRRHSPIQSDDLPSLLSSASAISSHCCARARSPSRTDGLSTSAIRL